MQSWLTYEAGKKGCTGEGYGVGGQHGSVLEACQTSCEEVSNCNAISWNSRDNRCYLKSKHDACNDMPCDWGRGDALDWNFYWKKCGKYFSSTVCIK